MRRRLSFILIIAIANLLAAASVPLQARRAGASYSWVGTAKTVWTMTPGEAFDPRDWSGDLRDERTIQLRVKETRQRDVTDANGRMIGQIVSLEDDGSTWTGRVDDTEVHLGNIRLTGGGTGSGKAMVIGTLYRSAVTPNPLADILPDGSYAFSVTLTPPIRYERRTIEPNRRTEVSQEQSISGLIVGDARIAHWLAMSGKAPTEASVRAAAKAPVPNGLISEGRPRALEGGRIAGRYDTLPNLDRGTRQSAEWSLDRLVSAHATLTEVPKAWRPEFNSETAVTASIDPSLNLKGRFRFTLYDVTREPGTAMNAGSGTGLDLVFSPTQPAAMSTPVETADGWTIETSAETVSATVNIRALDYGGWGVLKAEVYTGGAWQLATTASGQAFAIVPYDADGDRIADDWEERAGIAGHEPEEDADSTPAGANLGDGFSNYEEYRGFVLNSVWTSTDPTIKELFINNNATDDGCGDFSVTGVVCMMINADEYDANRVVNFNAHYRTAGPQKGIYIRNDTLDVGVLGQTFPAIGPPNEITEIVLDLRFIATFNLEGRGADGEIVPITIARSSVIAHEIGHAVNIDHHGTNVSGGACGTALGAFVALWGGAYSGDRSCFMAYPRPSQYQRSDGTCYSWPWPAAWGNTICSSKAGTGINAPPERIVDGHPMPVSGDATNGNCAHQLRIRR